MKPVLILAICGFTFTYGHAQRTAFLDVVITEIFADPSPAVGMPNSEFIEIKNRSSAPVALDRWMLTDGLSLAILKTPLILQPDSFAIICASSSQQDYSRFGMTVGVTNFPSLNNDGDTVILRTAEGKIAHSVIYSPAWYRNDIKALGGWSIEMVDPNYPCNPTNNWRASIDPSGASPGKLNSVNDVNPDHEPPRLVRSYPVSPTRVVAIFDEPLDSTAMINFAFQMPPLLVFGIRLVSPDFSQVVVELTGDMDSRIYSLRAEQIADCAGNVLSAGEVRTALPQRPDTSDLVINEILFNPPSDGFDFIEIYNRGKNTLDLKDLYFASRTNGLRDITRLSNRSYLLFPGEFAVFTENPEWVQERFSATGKFHKVAIPSLPDTEGKILITTTGGEVIDELHYEDGWHFPLLRNNEGVSLERISPDLPTQSKGNWTSAASTVLYGTPGAINSQAGQPLFDNTIAVTPIFSPDNDGHEDYALISYNVPASGWTISLTIFDLSGKPVRRLITNATLGLKGTFKWDGLGDSNKILPIGIYIIVSELFHIGGKAKKFKNAATLARRF